VGDTFEIKRNDRLPLLTGRAVNVLTGEPLDNIASAPFPRFMMRASGAASPIIAATVGATIINASLARVGFVWQTGQTAATNGVQAYEGEFEFTFPDGRLQTAPSKGYIPISIELDIGP
jgi:hypothetical protein